MKSPSSQVFRIGLVTLCMFCIAAFPTAAKDVAGELQGGDWTAEDSPIRVLDNITLPTGETLAIGPGVRVEFTGPFKFVVHGQLVAEGTKNDSIVFTAADPAVDSLRWRGLRFINAARGCRMAFCRVEYGWARIDTTWEGSSWPDDNGGGIYIESSAVDISRCQISRNRADRNGGGLYGWFTQSSLRNTIIAANHSRSYGGGVFIAYSNLQILNCTVAFDTSQSWGGGIFVGAEGNPIITNTIIVGNRGEGAGFFPDFAAAQSSEPVVSFSCIRLQGDPYPGAGNITANPVFKDSNPTSLDLKLDRSSPCIDAGDPAMSSGQESDNVINIGAYGGTDDATESVPVFWNVLIDSFSIGIDFEDLRIHSSTSEEITVENRGHFRLFIDDLQFSSSAFFPDSAEIDSIFVPAYTIAPIEPGERAKIVINFQPSELITYEETVTFIISDTLRASPVLRLEGTGIDPIAQIDSLIHFGNRQIDDEHEIIIYMRNIGRSLLNVSSISTQGDGFDLEIDDNTIESGDRSAVTILFEPEIASGYEATATFRTNDRNLVVTLWGMGVGPKMVVEADTLFLGYVYFNGDTAEYSIPITNSGDQLLHITGASESSAAFSVGLPGEGLQVDPDSTVDLSVFFHPPAAGQFYETLLHITGNYPDTATVELSGRGMAEPGRYMFGDVTGTWEWNHDDPVDYIVLDSVRVPEYEVLKINAGSRILFEPDAFMKVLGEVRAIGTAEDSLYFIPRDESGTPESRWQGIELNNEDRTKLSFAVIRGSKNGLSIFESSPRIEFCTIYNNGDPDVPGSWDGGGVYVKNSGAFLKGCVIEGNIAKYGGGIYIVNSKPTITNCVIRSNNAEIGGGIYMRFQASAWMQSNLIYENTADSLCGGVAIYEFSSPQIINNTITNNIGGGLFSTIRSLPILVNTIVWNNQGSSIELAQEGNLLASYSDIEGGYRGTANRDTIPGFVDTGAHDFQLAANSFLIDAGNPEPSHWDYAFPPSKGTQRNDIGAYGGSMGGGWEAPDVSISVFQNPAFPRWIDVFVTTLETTESVPTCSLSVDYGTPAPLPMTRLEDYSFNGSFEAQRSGLLFITVDAVMTGNRSQKVGRVYNLSIIPPGSGGVISIAGLGGSLRIEQGTFDEEVCIISGVESSVLQPLNGVLFVSPTFFINGLNFDFNKPAELSVDLDPELWAGIDKSKLAIYRVTANGCQPLACRTGDGSIYAEINRGGRFVLAWGDVQVLSLSKLPPESYILLRAFPNPFNDRVSIEFELKNAGYTSLGIYNLTGRKVKSLVNRHFEAGVHSTVWDGRDANAQSLPSGIYWAKLEGNNQVNSIKLLLVR